jgi:hypothetical protein
VGDLLGINPSTLRNWARRDLGALRLLGVGLIAATAVWAA